MLAHRGDESFELGCLRLKSRSLSKPLTALSEVTDRAKEVLDQRPQLLLWDGMSIGRRLSGVRIRSFDLEHEVQYPVLESAQQLDEFTAGDFYPRANAIQVWKHLAL